MIEKTPSKPPPSSNQPQPGPKIPNQKLKMDANKVRTAFAGISEEVLQAMELSRNNKIRFGENHHFSSSKHLSAGDVDPTARRHFPNLPKQGG